MRAPSGDQTGAYEFSTAGKMATAGPPPKGAGTASLRFRIAGVCPSGEILAETAFSMISSGVPPETGYAIDPLGRSCRSKVDALAVG